jgi:hypothetical protein
MPRPQFTLRALRVTMLVLGAFLGEIRFERERQRRADEAAARAARPLPPPGVTRTRIVRQPDGALMKEVATSSGVVSLTPMTRKVP